MLLVVKIFLLSLLMPLSHAIAGQKPADDCLQKLKSHAEAIAHQSLRGPMGDPRGDTGDQPTHDPQLLVFVSFSMPLEGLKTLASQVNQVGGKLILRGLVKGSFQETISRLKHLQEEILIDPTLFEAYQVTVVPTFVLRRTDKSKQTKFHDQLRGNVSLAYALEKFGAHGSQEAAQLLNILRHIR